MFNLLKWSLRYLLVAIYRVEVRGLEHYHRAGRRVLIVANHLSFLDPLLLGVFLPDRLTFAINTHIAQRWWLKPFLGLSHVFPMDPTHPILLKDLIRHLKNDTKTVIFPEGRISATGALMKIFDGPGMVADKSGATVLPVCIDGTQYTHFSKLKKLVRLRLFPKIIITIHPPTRIEGDDASSGRIRRQQSGHLLTDIMTEALFNSSSYRHNIFSALLAARDVHGGSHKIIEDLERRPVDYHGLITQCIALGRLLRPLTEVGEHVGVFLPNSAKTVAVILGLQATGRVPAMLNFATGSAGMSSACRTAGVKTVLTSRRFLVAANMTAEAEALSAEVAVVYLEDLAASISPLNKLWFFCLGRTARFWFDAAAVSPEHAAVILFTSGSESEPKGVVLSHANILANHSQLRARMSFHAQDTVLNFLPMFHSFGFTVGTLLPVLSGMKTFFYPTPLHYSVIPEIAYEIDATIMFATNTFLAQYGKKAHPYDFYSMRYVVAGAEKLHENTRRLWADKFGIRILEGYGATETAPVTSVNTPQDYQAGTVGRFMPAMQYRVEAVPGIATGGQLHVKGPNIMRGYLLPDKPGELQAPASVYGTGWYDTGDIVEVDDRGFITIRGRSKRFAKISGEMVSLTAVEQLASQAWPEAKHAVVSVPDAKKGEQLVLLTTQAEPSVKALLETAKGVAAIAIPRKIFSVEALPVLATGKTDYPAVAVLAQDNMAAADAVTH